VDPKCLKLAQGQQTSLFNVMASQCRALFISSLAGMSMSEPMSGGLRGAVLAEQSCRQAVEGEECHGAMKWAKDIGIFQNPEWYPDLTPDSPVEDFQAHLHSINHGNCPEPCNATSVTLPPATPVCHTAVEGEDCYGAVTWAMDTGIFSNPEWYPNLTSSSSFEDFQARLHSIRHGNCPLPCPSVPTRACKFSVVFCGYSGYSSGEDTSTPPPPENWELMVGECSPDGRGGAYRVEKPSSTNPYDPECGIASPYYVHVDHYQEETCTGAKDDSSFMVFTDGYCGNCCDINTGVCNSRCAGFLSPA